MGVGVFYDGHNRLAISHLMGNTVVTKDQSNQ